MPEELRKEVPAGETPDDGSVNEQDQVAAGEQPSETQEERPEFWLDEDGNLQGVFDDWFEEPESQETAGEEKAEPEEEKKVDEERKEEVKYYTPEELASLELSQIDPARLPPELRPYYEAILKQEGVKQAQEQMQVPQESELYDQIQAEARRRVEQKLGQPFDESDPKHVAALAVEATKVAQEIEKRMQFQQRLAELRAQEPYFMQIDQYAQQKLMELPAKEFLRIQQALQNGDTDTVLSFWEQCRREFYEQKLGQKIGQEKAENKPQVQTSPEPPRVEPGGKGEVETRPRIRPSDFARMTEDEQVEALIKLGLV